jgi:hypothetical protein
MQSLLVKLRDNEFQLVPPRFVKEPPGPLKILLALIQAAEKIIIGTDA